MKTAVKCQVIQVSPETEHRPECGKDAAGYSADGVAVCTECADDDALRIVRRLTANHRRPLTKTGIRAAAHERLKFIEGRCNSGLITANLQIVRGLIWALQGRDPGRLVDAEETLLLLGFATKKCSADDGCHYAFNKRELRAELRRCKSCSSVVASTVHDATRNQ